MVGFCALGNGAALQHLPGAMDDLSLQLVGIRHSENMAPRMETNWEHGEVKQEVFLGVCRSCNCASFFRVCGCCRDAGTQLESTSSVVVGLVSG